MWVVQQKNGKFKYTERYEDFLTGKQKYVSTTLTKSSPQAHNKAKQILSEKIKKKQEKRSPKSDITVREACSLWVKFIQKSDLAYNTKVSYISNAKIIAEEFNEIKISRLTPNKVNMYLLNLLNQGLAHSTVKIRKSAFLSMLKFASNYNFFVSDELQTKLEVPRMNTPIKTSETDKFLEKKEADYIFSKLKGTPYYYIFKIQLYTGMRYSEAAAISLNQIDFKNKTIFVNRQWLSNKHDFALPKENKTRIAVFNDQLDGILKKWLKKREGFLKLYNVDTDLLIFNKSGKPYTSANANYNLKKIKFSKNLTTHIFRHTYITRMVENYVPIKLIAKQVGHSSIKMIEEVYGHFSQKMEKDLANKVSKIEF